MCILQNLGQEVNESPKTEAGRRQHMTMRVFRISQSSQRMHDGR